MSKKIDKTLKHYMFKQNKKEKDLRNQHQAADKIFKSYSIIANILGFK